MALELIVGLINVITGVTNYYFSSENFSIVNISIGGILILLGIVFLRIGAPIRQKIKKLQQDHLITE